MHVQMCTLLLQVLAYRKMNICICVNHTYRQYQMHMHMLMLPSRNVSVTTAYTRVIRISRLYIYIHAEIQSVNRKHNFEYCTAHTAILAVRADAAFKSVSVLLMHRYIYICMIHVTSVH
jgi:hypothetical protein